MKKVGYFFAVLVLAIVIVNYSQVVIHFNRIEDRLFGEHRNQIRILDRSVYGAHFPLADMQYFFFVDMNEFDESIRPAMLTLVDDFSTKNFAIEFFGAEGIYSSLSLSSNEHLSLYIADIMIPNTPCSTYSCALYWLEDAQNNKLLVSVINF